MKFVAWMLVRDEQWYVDMALRSLENYCDKVVIIDTGSTDSTLEKIAAFGDLVHLEQRDRYEVKPDERGFYHRAYFCNIAIRIAKSYRPEFLLAIDADEYFLPGVFDLPYQFPDAPSWATSTYSLSSLDPLTYFADLSSQDDLNEPHIRLVRNLPGYGYVPNLMRPEYGYCHSYPSWDDFHLAPLEKQCPGVFHLHFRWLGPKRIRDAQAFEYIRSGIGRDEIVDESLLDDVDPQSLAHLKEQKWSSVPPGVFA